MEVVTTISALHRVLKVLRGEKRSRGVGFVPTMGALHDGHAQLIKAAQQSGDAVVCSIFVNPAQFNAKADFDHYPRTSEQDQLFLEQLDCDVLFVPRQEEVYPNGVPTVDIDLKGLDSTMEGAFRPGHFKGVLAVVHRLFELVQPERSFFGQKDFQQLAIVQHMVSTLRLATEIVPVETVRSREGLALSSRNNLLSAVQKQQALILYHTLKKGREWAATEKNAQQIRDWMTAFFNRGMLRLEYLSVIDKRTLKEVETIDQQTTCCIAAYCGTVRLIDNMPLL